MKANAQPLPNPSSLLLLTLILPAKAVPFPISSIPPCCFIAQIASDHMLGNEMCRLIKSPHLLCIESDTSFAKQFVQTIRQVQNYLYAKLQGQLLCPDCAGCLLIRKGWRKRHLKTSRGSFRLQVLQANCKTCGRTFRPLNDLIGLPFSRRFLDEFVEKGIRTAVDLPFAKASRMIKILTGYRISAETIRQKIHTKAADLELDKDVTGKTVLVDSTKVKSCKKKRGASVHLAITARKGPEVAERPSIHKRLLHLHVGNSRKLRKRLKTIRVENLVHDGFESLTGCAPNVQRCLWHLVHQLKYYLRQDGVPFGSRSFYQNSLKRILWDSKNGPEKFKTFVKDLENSGLKQSAKHLSNAQPEAFTWANHLGFSFTTTAPLEREMRELNRRADVGARWSDKGIENVLKVLFHYRLNEKPVTPKEETYFR